MRTSLFDMLTINTATISSENGRTARVPMDLTALSFKVLFLPHFLSFVIFVPGVSHSLLPLLMGQADSPSTQRTPLCGWSVLQRPLDQCSPPHVSSPGDWAVSMGSHMQQKADGKVRRRHGLGPLTNWRSFSPSNRCFRCALHRVFDAPSGARQCTKCVFRYSPINDPGGHFAIHERRFFRAPYHFESFNNAWYLEAPRSRTAPLQRVTFFLRLAANWRPPVHHLHPKPGQGQPSRGCGASALTLQLFRPPRTNCEEDHVTTRDEMIKFLFKSAQKLIMSSHSGP